ncbi:enoyl-CoA hydratase [Oceanibium sediminis]|uniref:enoyl-CoA hydratase n=1 Tax=Oceanibium sediminis TaxID=2026339 RepID=UPI000DD45E7F|nr:enoyl-CoA hydratase [Oceanibium sediminis]
MTPESQTFDDGRLVLDVAGPVARITFNNPGRLNAMRLGMWSALGDICAALATPGDIRVVLLSGAGERAFVSGADISEFGAVRSGAAAVERYDAEVARAEDGLSALPIPTLARIRGHCVGGGLGIAVRCDLRVAATDARFAVTPAKLGLGYVPESVAALYRLLGPSVTADLLFTARQMDAEEALRTGLVNQVVLPGALDAHCDDTAARIAANAPLTIRAIKEALKACGTSRDPETFAAAARLVEACCESDDYQEGQAAFAEKRAPRFTGT